jgi:GNAT superfamily N-acetyltransferase
MNDYAALERYHYRAGRPATHVRVLAARDARDHDLAGVMVVSMPTLNGRWRLGLWGDRFGGRDRARSARAINDELRTISRVVVDPRYRGLGLATRLVRAYLNEALTPATEAIAAMGWCCPFFARAGMREAAVGRAPRDERLARRLRGAGVEPEELIEVGRAAREGRRAEIARAVNIWARAGKSDRRWAGSSAHAPWWLVVRAAGAASARAVGYGWDSRWIIDPTPARPARGSGTHK